MKFTVEISHCPNVTVGLALEDGYPALDWLGGRGYCMSASASTSVGVSVSVGRELEKEALRHSIILFLLQKQQSITAHDMAVVHTIPYGASDTAHNIDHIHLPWLTLPSCSCAFTLLFAFRLCLRLPALGSLSLFPCTATLKKKQYTNKQTDRQQQ
jgi:prepilin signal peptidase PulO-like enzyme (type II secretory pathway)